MLASAKAVNARVAFFCSPLLYQTVAEHYETWLELASAGQFDGQGDHHPQALRAQSVCQVS